mmetsp:Transcript_126423/g.223992  ORF Transcript_126423/g.223992 Transcript_126423/m.223992 type:complete len:248 (+) Transcript_126423:145-888(+)
MIQEHRDERPLAESSPLSAYSPLGRSMMKDQDLQEIEAVILEMETLEHNIVQKKEEMKFIDGVIAEKQRQCEQLKQQHDERIRALQREARKVRNKRDKRGDMPGRSPSRSSEAYDGAQRRAAARSHSPAARSPTPVAKEPAVNPLEALDLPQLERALGAEEQMVLLAPLADGASSDGQDAAVTQIKLTLEARLKAVQQLNSRLAGRLQRIARLGSAPPPHEREALFGDLDSLKDEVRVFIDVDNLES